MYLSDAVPEIWRIWNNWFSLVYEEKSQVSMGDKVLRGKDPWVDSQFRRPFGFHPHLMQMMTTKTRPTYWCKQKVLFLQKPLTGVWKEQWFLAMFGTAAIQTDLPLNVILWWSFLLRWFASRWLRIISRYLRLFMTRRPISTITFLLNRLICLQVLH